MSKDYGILLVSHVTEIADGLVRLLDEVASDVTIKTAGGTDENDVGTDFNKIQKAIDEFEEDSILAFYDLGSAKLNLEMAMEYSEKNIKLYDVSFIEGAYVAASLLQTGVGLSVIEEQLEPLQVKD